MKIETQLDVGQAVWYVSQWDDGKNPVYWGYEKGKVESIGIDDRTIWYNCRYESGLSYSHPDRDYDINIFCTEVEAVIAVQTRILWKKI